MLLPYSPDNTLLILQVPVPSFRLIKLCILYSNHVWGFGKYEQPYYLLTVYGSLLSRESP